MNLSGELTPLPKAGRSAVEIRALHFRLRKFQQRLSGLLRARMALVGGIAHDVRTFAARLRLRIDTIPDESERAKAAGDIDAMIRLLDDALLASRVGAEGVEP